MSANKRVLLIAGGGTLGTYTAKELLALGHPVDIICLEDKTSDNENLKYYKANASIDYLENLFKTNKYDGIVNFIHYRTVEDYKPYHELLSKNTEHLIFLSSYRVYADLEHPVTENAPRLLDVTEDEEFLRNETYALPKARCEDYIRNESGTKNWTIVRPVISFSENRFDFFMHTGHSLILLARENKPVYMPINSKNHFSSLDWAGNSGKLIAHLLFNEEAKGDTYTISTAQNLTWGEIADIYTELLGIEVKWVDEEEYIKANPALGSSANGDVYWAYVYDRCFDRKIDNSKVLKATGLTSQDFVSIKDGIKIELENLRRKS